MRMLAVSAAMLVGGCSPPEQKEVAPAKAVEPKSVFEMSKPQAAAARKAAMDRMLDLYLLRRGHFRALTPDERPERIAHVQEGIRALGIDATIQACDWMGVIANGNASGAYAFGGICRVEIAGKPATTFVVCHDRIGGTTLAKPDGIGLSDEDGELLLRRLCV